MNTWSPVVYARTYVTDYRLIAAPSFLEADVRQQWLKKYIGASMYSAEELSTQRRWVMFQSQTCRVFGVTCMVRDLVGESDYLTKDVKGRDLFAFVGYAATRERRTTFPILPTMPGDLGLFAGFFEYIRPHWLDEHSTRADTSEPRAIRFAPDWRALHRLLAGPRSTLTIRGTLSRVQRTLLNCDPHMQALWRDSPWIRAFLWRAGSQVNQPTSMCFTLASRRDAGQGPYMNATITGLAARGERRERDPGLGQFPET